MKKLNFSRERARLTAGLKRHLKALIRVKKTGRNAALASLNIVAPTVFSFTRNPRESLKFLKNLRRAADGKRKFLRKGRWVWPRLGVDLSKIEEISIPAAVVLAAEFERWSLLHQVQLKPSRLSKWSSNVRDLFSDLGLFDLLKIEINDDSRGLSDKVILLPLVSGTSADGQKVAMLQADLRGLGVIFDHKTYIFDGLSEAISNSIDHGYLTDDEDRFPRLKGRWWATSCYDPATESLRFFVYDQGVGIARTLLKQEEWVPLLESVLGKFLGSRFSQTDEQVIRTAFEIGRTRTRQMERGKGLDQMAGVVRMAGGGYMRVLSGRGDVKTNCQGIYEGQSFDRSVGGTLVEWSIPIAILN